MLCRAKASSVSQVGLDAAPASVLFLVTGGVSFCSGVDAPEVLDSEPKVTPLSLVYTPSDLASSAAGASRDCQSVRSSLRRQSRDIHMPAPVAVGRAVRSDLVETRARRRSPMPVGLCLYAAITFGPPERWWVLRRTRGGALPPRPPRPRRSQSPVVAGIALTATMRSAGAGRSGLRPLCKTNSI
jgi:hypothetical protein